MSNLQQQSFLKSLKSNLSRQKIGEYRRGQADGRFHNFTVSGSAVANAFKVYLKENHPEVERKQLANILRGMKTPIKNFIHAISVSTHKERERKYSDISILHDRSLFFQATFPEKMGKTGRGTYDKVYATYKNVKGKGPLATVINDFNNVVKEENIKNFKKVGGGGKILNIAHEEFAGILESAVAYAIDKAITEASNGPSLVGLKSFLALRGVDLKVIRKISSFDNMEMTVALDSKSINLEDMKTAKERLSNLREEVEIALNLVQKDRNFVIPFLGGSDSFADVKRKKINKLLSVAFNKIPETVVIADDKLQKANTTTKSKRKPKSTAIRNKVTAKPVKRRKNKVDKQSAASRALAVMAMINKELPAKIRKNMNFPALENQTGRFAESVKLTNVITTPRGFPSYSYKYQQNPYEVFETTRGKLPWATPERDPRKLIEATVRETAAKFALGRFFLRRE
jgi:hypothetical protein